MVANLCDDIMVFARNVTVTPRAEVSLRFFHSVATSNRDARVTVV